MAYQQITRAEVRGLLQNRLGTAGTVFWREDELNRIIQEALRTFNAMTGFWKGTFQTQTSNDEHWINTGDTSVTSSMRVLFNGLPLAQTSLHDLDMGRPYWESEHTESGDDVPTTVQMWAPAGFNMFAIWPADHQNSNSLLVDGIAITPILTADADKVNIGKEELTTLLDYMQHLATFKEGGAEFEASMELYKNFLKGCAERNAILMGSAPFRKWLGLDKSPEKRIAHPRIGGR
jgi:hypothetical protein